MKADVFFRVGGFICQFTHWFVAAFSRAFNYDTPNKHPQGIRLMLFYQEMDILCPPNLGRSTINCNRLLGPGDLSFSVSLKSSVYNRSRVELTIPRLLRRKAQTLRKETGDQRWIAPIEKLNRSVAQTVGRSIYRPLLLLILEPMCLNLCIFSAILLGIIYLFFGAFQLVFASVYGMTLWQRGLCFLGLFVGMALAIMTDPLWRRNYARLERGHQKTVVGMVDGVEEFLPEWRLPPGTVLLLPFGQVKIHPC